jgi:hypothetical protein
MVFARADFINVLSASHQSDRLGWLQRFGQNAFTTLWVTEVPPALSWATVGPSLFRVTSRRILRTTSVNSQK